MRRDSTVTTVTGLSSSLMTATSGSTTTGNATSPAGTWNRTYPNTQTSATASLAAGNWITWTTTASTGYEYSFNGLTGLNINRTSTGPSTAALFYSTDGGLNFSQTGGNFVTSSTLTPAASTFSTTMSSSPIKLLSGTTGIVWRLVGFGSGASRMGIGTTDAVDFTMLGTVDVTPALNLTWAASGGTGTWDTSPSNQNWTYNSGSAAAPFTNGDNVTFSGSGGVVTVSGTVSPGTMAATNASGTYQFTGGSIRATGAATKSGAGTLVLSSSSSYALGWSVTGGMIVPDATGALGSAAVAIDGATLAEGALLEDLPAVGWNQLVRRLEGHQIHVGPGSLQEHQIPTPILIQLAADNYEKSVNWLALLGAHLSLHEDHWPGQGSKQFGLLLCDPISKDGIRVVA
jgi:autotransporter-associated beta strand protein